jgi:16S rRNA G966 N2-methylase RsmD
MEDNTIIVLPGQITASKTGLIFNDEISYSDWESLGSKLQHIEGAVHWWIGDWLNYGEKNYGEIYSQALDQTGYDYSTLKHDKWVSGRIELCRRRHKLNLSIHEEVASLEPDDQDYLLEMAETNDWKRNDMRQQIKAYQRKKLIEARILSDIDFTDTKLILGDMNLIGNELENNSIDFILTDPPYKEEYINCWDNLSKLASRVLKPSGFLIAYSGQLHIPEVIQKLSSTGLQYYWTMCLIHNGGSNLINSRSVLCGWKPLFIFQKEPFHKIEFVDVIQGTGREKDFHEWAQAIGELDYIIDKFTIPGDLILDPFAGSGTTLIAAKKNNRRSIGIEIDETNYKIALSRLDDELSER